MRRSARRRDESGQVTVLIIGLAAILLLAVAIVVDASAAYLQRTGLDTVADGAALAGTEALDVEAGYEHGLTDLELSRDRAAAAVADYLRATGARDRFPGLDYTVVVDVERVEVRVSAPLRLPFTVPGTAEVRRVATTGAAELSTS